MIFLNNVDEFKLIPKEFDFKKGKILVYLKEKNELEIERNEKIKFVRLKECFTPELVYTIDDEILNKINSWYEKLLNPFVESYRIDFGEIIKYYDFTRLLCVKLSYFILITKIFDSIENLKQIITLNNNELLEILKIIAINKGIPIKIVNLNPIEKLRLKLSPFDKKLQEAYNKFIVRVNNTKLKFKFLCLNIIGKFIIKFLSLNTLEFVFRFVISNTIIKKFMNLNPNFEKLEHYFGNLNHSREERKSPILGSRMSMVIMTYPYMIFRLNSLVKELSKDFVIYLLERDKNQHSGEFLAKNYKNVYPVHFEYYIDSKIRRNTKNFKKFIKKLFLDLNSSGKFEDVFKYEGMSYWKLIENDINKIYSESLSEIYERYQVYEKILKMIKPLCVFSTNDVLSVEKTFFNAAKNNNFPTYVSQHGLFQRPKPGYPPLYADKILLWGKLCARALKGIGCNEEKFVIIGNPSYDPWLAYLKSGIDKSKIFNDLKINETYKIILCSVIAEYDLRAEIFRHDNITPVTELLKMVKEDNSLFLILKLHPGEKPEPYKNLIKKLNVRNCKVIGTYDVKDLLSISDILVMVASSTLALEAFLFGKHVIYVNFTGLRDTLPIREYNAGIVVYELKDLKSVIYNVLTNEDLRSKLKIGMKNFIKDALHEFNGKTALRTSNYLKKIGG